MMKFLSLVLIICCVASVGIAQPIFKSIESIPRFTDICLAPDGFSYLATTYGVMRSTDQGITWTTVQGTDQIYPVDLYIDSTNNFYIAGNNGFFISRGGPDRFELVYQSNFYTTTIEFAKDNRIVISFGQNAAIAESRDTGKTWNSYDYVAYRVSPQGVHYRYSSAGKWSQSTNKGQSWTNFAATYGKLSFGPDNHMLLLTSAGMEISSNGGISWLQKPLHQALRPGKTQLVMDVSRHLYAVTPREITSEKFYGAIYRSTDLGDTWDSLEIPGSVYFGGATPWNDVWISTGALYVIKDGVLSQVRATPSLIQAMTFTSTTTWAIGSNSPETYGNELAGIFFSTDDGMTWLQTNQPTRLGYATGIEVSEGNVFIAISATGPTEARGIYRSTDQGSTWATSLIFTGDTVVTKLKKLKDNTLLAGTSRAGIYRSVDGGTTWAVSNAGITNGEINALIEDQTGRVLIGTDDGIFLSTDGGLTWSRRDMREHNPKVYALAVDRFGVTYAGTGYGLLRSNDLVTWEEVYVGLTDIVPLYVAVDSADGLYAGYYYQFFGHYSGDNGVVWHQIIPTDQTPFYLQGFWTSPSGYVYASSDVALLRSEKPLKLNVNTRKGNATRGVIALTTNGVRLDPELTGELTLKLFDRLGRRIYLIVGNPHSVEAQLRSVVAVDVGWYAYQLESRSVLHKGILQF